MLKFVFAFVVLIHGLIHFMGFAKAFGYGNITQLTKEISKTSGAFWMITAFLFIAVTILFLLKKDSWYVLAASAVIISQALIAATWKDAKFGTIANVLIVAYIIYYLW